MDSIFMHLHDITCSRHFDLAQKFTSNRQDWADFGQYVQNAMVTSIRLFGAHEPPEMPSIQKSMEHMFE